MQTLTVYTPSGTSIMQLIDASDGGQVGAMFPSRHSAPELTLHLWVPTAWHPIADIEDLDNALERHGYRLAVESRPAAAALICCDTDSGSGTSVSHLWAITVNPHDNGFDILAGTEIMGKRIAHVYLDDTGPAGPGQLVLAIDRLAQDGQDGDYIHPLDSAEQVASTLEAATGYRLTTESLQEIRELAEQDTPAEPSPDRDAPDGDVN